MAAVANVAGIAGVAGVVVSLAGVAAVANIAGVAVELRFTIRMLMILLYQLKPVGDCVALNTYIYQ